MSEADKVFKKSYKCPICDSNFKCLTVKQGKARMVSSDIDLKVNYRDVAEWLGIDTKYSRKSPPGLFNFRPAVRPCPVTVHIEGFSEKKYHR